MFYPQFKDPDVKTKIEKLEDERDNWEEMYEGYKFQLSRKFPPQAPIKFIRFSSLPQQLSLPR